MYVSVLVTMVVLLICVVEWVCRLCTAKESFFLDICDAKLPGNWPQFPWILLGISLCELYWFMITMDMILLIGLNCCCCNDVLIICMCVCV